METYFLIRKHPSGGYGAILQTDGGPILELNDEYHSFDSIDAVADHVFANKADAKVRIHSECVGEYPTPEQSLEEATEVILKANAELLRLYSIIEDIDEYAGELTRSEDTGLRYTGKQLRVIIKD